jgi:hypothetical protein
MLWKEFLQKMEEQGIKPDDEIQFVDFSRDNPILEVENQAEVDRGETYHNGDPVERRVHIW